MRSLKTIIFVKIERSRNLEIYFQNETCFPSHERNVYWVTTWYICTMYLDVLDLLPPTMWQLYKICPELRIRIRDCMTDPGPIFCLFLDPLLMKGSIPTQDSIFFGSGSVFLLHQSRNRYNFWVIKLLKSHGQIDPQPPPNTIRVNKGRRHYNSKLKNICYLKKSFVKFQSK